MKPFESIGGPLAGELSEIKLCSAWGLPSWKPSRLLKQLKRAVETPKTRRIGELLPKPERLYKRAIRIRHTDLEAFARLVRCNSCSSEFSQKAGWGRTADENDAVKPAPLAVLGRFGGERDE